MNAIRLRCGMWMWKATESQDSPMWTVDFDVGNQDMKSRGKIYLGERMSSRLRCLWDSQKYCLEIPKKIIWHYHCET